MKCSGEALVQAPVTKEVDVTAGVLMEVPVEVNVPVEVIKDAHRWKLSKRLALTFLMAVGPEVKEMEAH